MTLNFQEFLEEQTGKNLHLEHLEDMVINDGADGVRQTVFFLKSLRDMLAGHTDKPRVNLTTKWDGAPAIFAGINPDNGRFFVGTKGVFAKNAKLNYTPADIEANHPSDGLREKLKIALRYLPELGIDGVVQGDMMFTQNDLKMETIEGVKYVTFQPNTIVYAIPADTNLAKQILTSKMGIVWHTSYSGKSMSSMSASFNINIGKFRQSKNVWFRDASFVDLSGTATFTEDETEQLNKYIEQIESIYKSIPIRLLNFIATSETYKLHLKTYYNSKIREGQKIHNTNAHLAGLMSWVEMRLNKGVLEAKKADTKTKRLKEKNEVMRWYQTNKYGLKLIFDLQNAVLDAKLMVVRKLERMQHVTNSFIRTDDGFKVTAPEGFVAVDELGTNAIKLVDRLTFSHANFNAAKAWNK